MADASGKKTCFVISPIGKENTPEREKADIVLEHFIRKAVPQEYEVKRADEISDPGMITVQIIERVIEADLVIAYIDGPNANVFYELAIRHAAHKPMILLRDKGYDIPFDVKDARAITIDVHSVVNYESSVNEIIEQIKSINSGTEIHTPISTAMAAKLLRQSGDTSAKAIADLVVKFDSISAMLQTMRPPRTINAEASDQLIFSGVIDDNTRKLLSQLYQERASGFGGSGAGSGSGAGLGDGTGFGG